MNFKSTCFELRFHKKEIFLTAQLYKKKYHRRTHTSVTENDKKEEEKTFSLSQSHTKFVVQFYPEK